MKVTTAITYAGLFAAAHAAVEYVELVAESKEKDINGSGVSSIHEGAGTDYLLLGKGSRAFEYEGEDKELYESSQGQSFRQVFAINDNILTFSGASGDSKPEAGNQVTFDSDGYLAAGGSSDGFYACKNINDPYNYSKDSYFLLKFSGSAPQKDCVSVKLRKTRSSPTSSGAGSSVGPTSEPSKAPESSGYHNGTVVTTQTTVTDWTTYCPEPTTVTISTCDDHKCAPTTITCTEPTTLTVTGECVVPTTNHPGPGPSPTKHTSAAAESTAPSVSTYAGGAAAQNYAGALAGVAAVAAILI